METSEFRETPSQKTAKSPTSPVTVFDEKSPKNGRLTNVKNASFFLNHPTKKKVPSGYD
jgi:hypothetical protein